MQPPLTLKQRLSALSDAQSSPSASDARTGGRSNAADSYGGPYREAVPSNSGFSSSAATLSTTTKKLKAFTSNLQAPSWMTMKKNGKGHHRGAEYAFARGREGGEGEDQNRLVQDVLGNLIFQAGVDYETRPMVVMNASAFPDPQLVSYDLLLSRILSYLNLYVEADYTVVFLAAGSRHTPSWNWIWKAYRSLSRKYRKNLKQLYIVHSSFFSKMLFSLAGAIISPKFFRKITYITTLSDLAQRVPLTQIDIPPAAYQENLKYERKITLPIPTRSSVFGVPLEDLMGYDGEKSSVPRVIKDAAQFLRDTGMKDEGLFRRSPSSVLLRAAQEAYDRGNVVSLETFGDPHLAAVLIKKYLRDLPDPLVPESLYGVIMACPISPGFGQDDGSAESEREAETVGYIRDSILPELVPCSLTLLSFILHLLHDVSLRSDTNRMNAFNLAMMISPNLVKGTNALRDVMMCSVPLPTAMAPGSGGGTESAGTAAATFGNGNVARAGGTTTTTTLGMVITFCIRRYYEVFDEYVDRSEAVKPWRAFGFDGRAEDEDDDDDDDDGAAAAGRGTGANGHAEDSAVGTYVLGEDEEDLDDESVPKMQASTTTSPSAAAIVRPDPDPDPRFRRQQQRQAIDGNLSMIAQNASPSVRSLFNTTSTPTSTATGSPSAWNARQNSSSSSSSAAAGVYVNGGRKTRSMISIESTVSRANNGNVTVRRGGSIAIAIGRGTTKGSGSAVEAVSVTAAGFFVPPGSGGSPTRTTTAAGGGGEGEAQEQEERVSVAERRKMFENSSAG